MLDKNSKNSVNLDVNFEESLHLISMTFQKLKTLSMSNVIVAWKEQSWRVMVPESRGRGRPAQRWILDTKDTLGIKVHEIGQLARQQESYFTLWWEQHSPNDL